MFNERELLVHFLIGDDAASRKTALVIDERHLWRSLIDVALVWKALPALKKRLSALKVELDSTTLAHLRRLSAVTVLRSSTVARRGVEAIELLVQAGVPVAAFKGLAAMAFQGSSRTLQDVDILISRQTLASAVLALEAKGYRRATSASIDQYVEFVHNSPGFSGNEAIVLTAPGGGDVDLHWRVGPKKSARFESAGLLTRSRQRTLDGRRIPVLDTIDLLLLTVHHAVRNNFVPDDTIRDLMDVQAWLDSLERDRLMHQVVEAAEEATLLAPMTAMAAIVARLRTGEAMSVAAQALAGATRVKEGRTTRSLENLFFSQLRNGPLNPDIIYLTGTRPLVKILAGGLSGWPKYRQRMRELEMRKDGAPVPLVRRLIQLWKSVVGLSAGEWSHLRTLARLKN